MTAPPGFPPERAFVVQFGRSSVAPTPTCGRIEHVASGRACRFESIPELLAFVERTLRATSDDAPRR